MKPVGIGLIGCGGRVRGLANLMKKHCEGAEFVAFADPSEASLQTSRESLNADAMCTTDYHELLANPAVEWVMIGSYNCFHREQTIAAFEAGKHVFCEKPLATTIEDCIAMRDAWKQAGDRQFIIGFTLRYSPHYRKIKELISTGKIGKIISMEFNETLGFNHGGYIHGDWRRLTKLAGTHLLEKCCHDVDLVNWMVGSPAKRVASFGGLNFFRPENADQVERLGVDPNTGKPAFQTWPGTVNLNPFTADKDIIDNQVAIVEFANQVRTTFHTNCMSAINERRMYINGTEGVIRADVVNGTIQLCRLGFNEEIQNVSTDASGGHGGGDEVLVVNLADVMHGKAEPFTKLEDGMRSAITCFAIDQAMETGAVVDVTPMWEAAGLPSN